MTSTTNPDRDPADAPVRYTVGDARFMVIPDGQLAIGPAGDCFPELSADEALAEFGDQATGQFRLPENLLVAEWGGARILFETGLGSTFAGSVGRDAGRALGNLRAAGAEPDSIDVIALTHAHPDHVGGLIADDGSAVFPCAEIVVARAEYDDVMRAGGDSDPDSFAGRQRAFARRSLAPYATRVRCLDDGDEVLAGVSLIVSPGHSPGHAAYAIDTSAGRILTWGDTCHHELLLRRPDLGFSADHDPRQAARSRRRLLDRIAAEGWRVHAYHFPYPGTGTVRTRADGGYEWVSADLSA